MSNLYEKINSLCQIKGIKGATLCNDLGISKGLITDLKMGRRTGVSAATAQKIASYFGVSVGYLLGEEEQKQNPPTELDLSDGEKMLIELFRKLPEESQKMYIEVLRATLKNLTKD